jgi:hypothetical protein
VVLDQLVEVLLEVVAPGEHIVGESGDLQPLASLAYPHHRKMRGNQIRSFAKRHEGSRQHIDKGRDGIDQLLTDLEEMDLGSARRSASLDTGWLVATVARPDLAGTEPRHGNAHGGA